MTSKLTYEEWKKKRGWTTEEVKLYVILLTLICTFTAVLITFTPLWIAAAMVAPVASMKNLEKLFEGKLQKEYNDYLEEQKV